MAAIENRSEGPARLGLWRLFILGRTAVTGAMLVLLLLTNQMTVPSTQIPLFIVTVVQFGINGIYLYLWKRRDLSLLGVIAFVIEIVLITLQILNFGSEGHVFVLAYLWPIVMAGRLIGRRAILPFTLLSILAYATIILLRRWGIVLMEPVLTAAGVSQALAMSLAYLAFVSLLLWALTSEVERGEERLNARNQELWRINSRLRALVVAGEELLGSLEVEQLLRAAVWQVEMSTGHKYAAVYLREGDALRLQEPHSLPIGVAASRRVRPVPERWNKMNLAGSDLLMPWRERLDDDEVSALEEQEGLSYCWLTHVALGSARGPIGVLTLLEEERGALDDPNESRVLQILGHQLSVALENARLFDDLRRESDLLRSILSHMSEGVFVADRTGAVLLGNRGAQEMLRVQQGQALPSWLQERLAVRVAPVALDGRLPIEANGRVISVSSANLPDAGDLAESIVYVARDVTQETQVERMKSEFLAYASHELRTPLATIKTMVRLMLLDAGHGSKLREHLTVVDTQVDRQTRMISNLLDLTRLEAGRYELTAEDVDVAQVVQSLSRGLRPLAEEKGLRLHVQCQRLPARIRTDTGAVEQIVLNLVGNAIKFTDKGNVTITGERSPNGIYIAVQDTGIGMTPVQLGHLFSKFYTARTPHKRGEGTGLGLAISQMLATELGGHISVTSQKGRGACFVLHLPLEMPPRHAPRPSEN